MQAVRDIVSLGLSTRAMHKLKVRQPLQPAEIVLGKTELEARLRPYVPLIAEELNVKEITFTTDAGDRVQFTVKPNYRALGPVFGKRMPVVRKALDGADPALVRAALASAGSYSLTLEDGETVELTSELVAVQVQAQDGYAASGDPVGTVILDTKLGTELIQEGLAREVQSRIQAIRKEQNLEYTARILVEVTGAADIVDACRAQAESIKADTLTNEMYFSANSLNTAIATTELSLGGNAVTIRVAKA